MRHKRTAPYGSWKGGDLDMCVNIHNENQCSENSKLKTQNKGILRYHFHACCKSVRYSTCCARPHKACQFEMLLEVHFVCQPATDIDPCQLQLSRLLLWGLLSSSLTWPIVIIRHHQTLSDVFTVSHIEMMEAISRKEKKRKKKKGKHRNYATSSPYHTLQEYLSRNHPWSNLSVSCKRIQHTFTLNEYQLYW